ncbi:MAG TPA: type II CAAX endopeptidase family protein [Gemmatimonadaceae bacterium]|nr:type II CAAX endopeptidase family protein [Gemmatimonadaceae bacterium]
MTARGWLFGADGRLHAAWRILAFLVIASVATLVLAQSVAFVAPQLLMSTSAAAVAVTGLIGLVGAGLAHLFMLAVVEKRGWRFVSLDRAALNPRALTVGAFSGTLAILVPSLLLVGVSWFRFGPAGAGSSLKAAATLLLILAPAAFSEELLIRGYIFSVARESWSTAAAVASTSIVFGLLHGFNPGASAQSLLVVMLAGAFLAFVLLATRSLYAAMLAHLAWNWTLAGVLHAAVSGLPFTVPDYELLDAGPDWATGGAWGPEGGLGAAIGLCGGIGYLYARHRRRRESHA